MSELQILQLTPHPSTISEAAKSLQLEVRMSMDDYAGPRRLGIYYKISGDMSQLRAKSEVRSPGRRKNLWRHTCMEAFVGDIHGTAYREFNFSPTGNWAAYAFSDERQRTSPDPDLSPCSMRWMTEHKSTSHTSGFIWSGLSFWARLLPEVLPDCDPKDWTIGFTAVIETMDGSLSYWAHTHPREVPDFHHPATRSLRV